MTIENAIRFLQAAKARGTNHIVMSYWEADTFEMQEGEEWAILADYLENKMDWSRTHEDLIEHKYWKDNEI